MEHKLNRRDFAGPHQQRFNYINNYFSNANNRKIYFSPKHIVPPKTQEEFEGLVIDYLTSNYTMKIDALTIKRNIQNAYADADNIVFVFKTFSINDALRDLMEKDCIECKEIVINFIRSYIVTKINEKELKKYKTEKSELFTIENDMEKYKEESKKIAMQILNKKYDFSEFQKDYLFKSIYDFDQDKSNIQILNINKSKSQEFIKKNILNKKVSRENSEYIINEEDEYNDYNDEEIYKMYKNDDENFNDLLYQPTAKALLTNANYQETAELLKSNNGNINFIKTLENLRKKYSSKYMKPFCEYGTRAECSKHNNTQCNKVHFTPLIKPHTDVNLGDCSYLDTCRHMDICKFVHYQIEDNELIPTNRKELILNGDENTLPSQWINSDIRKLDYSIIGKFDVIMADPPWDIHMDLPYGTLRDDEMKSLPIADLQDNGLIFLWVTGRSTELARECLDLWGYKRKEELIWIKTNQLQRLIRTGRTGHWLNHSKEHCLIGIKGNPKINRNLDCDVLVSEVRETSRKPDEIYELIERMSPGGRKLELFARAHNRRQGWLSIGNQLPGVYLVEEEMIEKFNKVYPNNKVTKEIMEENKRKSTKLIEVRNINKNEDLSDPKSNINNKPEENSEEKENVNNNTED